MNFFEVFSNPLRVQIMQYLEANGEATTKQISEAIRTASAPTVYRHVNYLIKEEYLIIKEKREVRGSLERLLTINTNKLTENAEDDVAGIAWQHFMSMFGAFQKYASCEDFSRDRVILGNCVLSISDEQFKELVSEATELIHKYVRLSDEAKHTPRKVSFSAVPIDKD